MILNQPNEQIQNVIRQLYDCPNTRMFGLSAAEDFSTYRLLFAMLNLDNSTIAATVERVLKMVGYESYLELVENVGCRISESLGTAKHPIHIIGFAFNNDSITQLKVYYMLGVFEQEVPKGGYAVGKINRALSQKAVEKIVEKLELSEQNQKVQNIFETMSSENLELEFIGLNIEKDAPLSLKLYFRPERQQ